MESLPMSTVWLMGVSVVHHQAEPQRRMWRRMWFARLMCSFFCP
jgi:hypothetical protein